MATELARNHTNDYSAPVPGLPVLALRQNVVFPLTVQPLAINRLVSVESVNRALTGDRLLFLTLQTNDKDEPDPADLRTIGTIGAIRQMAKASSGGIHIVVEGLTRYGRYLGCAFQIADDVLDLVGQEKATGKSLGTDLEQQKLTLPVIYLLNHAEERLKGELLRVLGNGHLDKRQLLQPYLAASGALCHAQEHAERLAAKARAELECLPPSACRDILQVLTEKVVHRDR